MITFLGQFPPVVQALMGTLFTWAMTALGAAGVFLKKDVDRRLLDTMLGFAGGVMIAASFWSLLAPAIEMSAEMALPVWLPAAVGFLLGRRLSARCWTASCPTSMPARTSLRA